MYILYNYYYVHNTLKYILWYYIYYLTGEKEIEREVIPLYERTAILFMWSTECVRRVLRYIFVI